MIASKVVTMPLPHGRDWLYYPDLNLLALAPHLDAAGRQRCADELAVAWRKSMRERLSVISTAKPSHPPRHTTAAPALAAVPCTPAADPSVSVV